ncbi:sulfatase-like hydrolase/transferase [Nocardioides sp.]|uniref:sulfatase-like hydrolase/transferase n=1 Tax=Nocardioides sp. TaxID=35761 RepID=UPI00272343F9|nr:sulfatase-like hydrolase/transferase [Nocardioides sp.]MDO9455714.1 sulfatase-like hydrolase/transferase [Nocardioides sp.]
MVAVLVVGGLVANVINQRAHSSDPVAEPDAVRVENAILFLVDDMSDFSCAEADLYLPKSSKWLRQQGTCFESATTATPVCCPARAQIQTGQLSHNNRVVSQIAAKSLDVRDTVQHDLALLGIDTYGIGKNLNGIDASEYYGVNGRDNGFAHFNFWNSYKGPAGAFKLYDDLGRRYTPTDGLSTTETNGAYLDAYLDDKLESGDPFFVYDAFVAPHKQGIGGDVSDLPPPSVNHADDPVPPFRFAPEGFDGDKLKIFRGARFPRSYYERLFTAKVRALYDVDDQMAATFQRLEDAGALDETAVIFTSDNGYTDRGQVNWEGKSIPYPAATNIPMLAWFPGRPPAVEKKPVSLIDIAPTLYDVFGVIPGHVVDGHSLLSDHRRELVYGEFYNESSGLARRESGPLASNLRSWRLIKRGRQAYVEWYGNGGVVVFREFYEDALMKKNLLSPAHARDRPPHETLRTFRLLLDQYGTCQGTEEQGSPNPCP